MLADVVTGASNVKTPDNVPAIAPTVMVCSIFVDAAVFQRQETDETDVHEAQVHDASAIRTVLVKSYAPKLRPVTVADRPPVSGAFAAPYDAAGASKLRPRW